MKHIPVFILLFICLAFSLRAEEKTISLEELIAEALQKNPAIQTAKNEVEGKKARIPQAGALPDPEVSFGQTNEESIVPFTNLGEADFSEIYVGFHQQFPLHGKRGLRERIAFSEAEAQTWMLEYAVRRLRAEVKLAFYDLYYWRRVQEIERNNLALLEKFAATAEALYSVGKGNQADVLRAQTEISRLQDRLEMSQQQIGIHQARLNSLLFRSPDEQIGPLAPVERAAFHHSMDQLRQLAINDFPLLKHQQEMTERSRLAAELAKKEKYPDVGLVFTYHNRGGLPDYWTIGGTTTLPLFAGRKQNKAVEEAQQDFMAAHRRYEDTLTMVNFELKNHYLSALTADRLTQLYSQTIVPQETLSLEATIAAYTVGNVEFLSVLDSVEKLLQDELRYWENFIEYQKALAKLENYAGIELTRSGGTP